MALALVTLALGVPNVALATIDTVTISAGGSTTIPVGGQVDLTADLTGAVSNPVYSWTPTGTGDIVLSSTTTETTTVTGRVPSATNTVSVVASDDDTSPGLSDDINIEVIPMTITATSITLAPGQTRDLDATSGTYTGSVTWSSSNSSVATVDATTGLVTAVSGGQVTITATNDPDYDAPNQTATCIVNVPLVTLTAADSTITAANTPTALTLTVQYGGTLLPAGSTVAWSYTGSVGTLTSYATVLSASGADTSTCSATFTSGSSGTNGSSTITAAITGSGYNTSKSTTVTVQTSKYLTLEGPSSLNSTTRTGLYTVYLHNADGTIDTTNSSSTAHWSWSSSYLSITSNTLNSYRADMHNGEAHIELYARYNTPAAGTRLYAWIDDGYSDRIYHTITITGLSSLPQTGQDFTLAYVFGGLGGALLVVTGVWYGIRKKRSERA